MVYSNSNGNGNGRGPNPLRYGKRYINKQNTWKGNNRGSKLIAGFYRMIQRHSLHEGDMCVPRPPLINKTLSLTYIQKILDINQIKNLTGLQNSSFGVGFLTLSHQPNIQLTDKNPFFKLNTQRKKLQKRRQRTE